MNVLYEVIQQSENLTLKMRSMLGWSFFSQFSSKSIFKLAIFFNNLI